MFFFPGIIFSSQCTESTNLTENKLRQRCGNKSNLSFAHFILRLKIEIVNEAHIETQIK